MARTAAELIAELEREGSRHWRVALAVNFAGGLPQFIRSDDPERQRMLDDMLRDGGTPLGLIVQDRAKGKGFRLVGRVLKEQAENQVSRDYLRKIAEHVAKVATSEGSPTTVVDESAAGDDDVDVDVDDGYEEACAEAEAHGLSTAGHIPTRHPEKALVDAICARSKAGVWDEARLEWRLVRVFIEDFGMRVCGKFPIKEQCVIRNTWNGNTMTVGNICVHQFLAIQTMAIFDGIRRVSKDRKKSLGKAAMEHFIECGWMNDWEREFYRDTLRKRRLSEKQEKTRVRINEKMLQRVRNRGLDSESQ